MAQQAEQQAMPPYTPLPPFSPTPTGSHQMSMAGEYLAKKEPQSSGARYQRVAT